MSWRYWDDQRRRPRRPASGIRAQTQRGPFGKTWWAGRWIAALERLVDAGRLSRGRSYARSGQVVSLEVGTEGVKARVQGSRPTPYRVAIRFRRLSDAEWERVADAMAAEALYAARLLAGEMPEQIETAFEAAGTSLFPVTRGDLQTQCSCPDWANPCKHVAAVHYLLGERFDADPFLLFELRGRTKEQVTEALRARRAGQAAGPEPTAPTEPAEAPPEAESSLAEALGAFWSLPAEVAELETRFVAPQVDALPVKRLGPPPFWRRREDFTALMEAAYRAISAEALRAALQEDQAATPRA